MRSVIVLIATVLLAAPGWAVGQGAPPSEAVAPSAPAAPSAEAPPPVPPPVPPPSAAPTPAPAAAGAPTAAGTPPAAGLTPAPAEVEVQKPSETADAVAPASGDDAYRLKVQELETRVNELKEKIFRSKSRLAILKETVLASSIAGSEAQIVHRNEMGSSFRLEKVSYSLDGSQIFSRAESDAKLDEQEEIEIFNGPIVPGNHLVAVVMVYRGNGYGIFSYLNGYVFTLRSSYTFRAEEGKLARLKIVGFEKGGMTTDLKDRPAIRFDTELVDVKRAASAAATPAEEDR
jgi:hypothetical protein